MALSSGRYLSNNSPFCSRTTCGRMQLLYSGARNEFLSPEHSRARSNLHWTACELQIRSHPMFRGAIACQSYRRLVRRSESRRWIKNGPLGPLGDIGERYLEASHIQFSSALVEVDKGTRDRKFMLDSSYTCWPAHSYLRESFSQVRGTRLGSKRLNSAHLAFPVVATRELAYLHSVHNYSDDEYEHSDSGDSCIDEESWRRRLNRLVVSNQLELISKEAKDRKDFNNLGPLLKRLNLHGHLYNKTVVISKVPLPNYRPDLDERRPQRQVVFGPCVKEKVESLLQTYLMQKRDYPSSQNVGNKSIDNPEERVAEGRYADKRTEKHIARVEELINEERLKKRSLRMKEKQTCWQQLPEGQAMLGFRQNLPSWKEREGLLAAISQHQVLVVSGETGCGKTTQLPQYILESEIESGRGGSCSIICTQPRRISAISVSERVASERGEELGDSVGYQVRLEGKKSKDTSLLFCTSGILLRRLMKDPELKGVSHVLVDEIHERGMNEDFLLIVLKNLLSRRPDLRLVLMSATLNAELFSSFFGGAPMVHIPGFTYPVETHFLEDVLPMIGHVLTPFNQLDDYGPDKQWRMAKQMRERSRKSQVNAIADDAMAELDYSDIDHRVRESLSCWSPESLGFNVIEKLLCHICKKEKEGAVLVFLTGMEDISAVMEKLRSNPLLGNPDKVLLLGCHGSMATGEQRLIFGPAPPGVRKIVLATNMAETSITINDVVYVVDCGKAKETSYDALNNTPCLLPQWISRASARQRRGRAGRVQPGVCYHLYPKAVHEAFDEYQLPELLRTPLQSLCLQIKSLGLGSIEEFLSKALQPPEQRAVHNAVELLKTIGALDDQEELTDLGRHLSALPVEPRLGKMLLMGSIFRCLDPILTIAAGLTTRDPFLMPIDKKERASAARFDLAGDHYSDHIGLVRAYNGWREAMNAGTGSDYCWRNFLSFQTLQGMQSLRKQFWGLLSDAGFDMEHCSENSHDQDLVRGVICAGLYPGVASAVHRQKSTTYKTKEDGQVNLHQNSINSREIKLVYPWLVFNEKVKTSSVNIRDSTGVSDSIILLFGGEIKKGWEPGQLLMQGGYLEFFMPRDVATLILMLREELDDLIQRKLEDPQLDLHGEGSLLLEAILELLRGDQCEGSFVYGRKISTKQDKHQKEEEEDIKGMLQQLIQKSGKNPVPRYWTTEVPGGGYQSSVLVRGKSFEGKPGSSKKQAEKNASRVALEWLVDSGSLKGEAAVMACDLRASLKRDSAKGQRLPVVQVAVDLLNKSKEVVKKNSPKQRSREAALDVFIKSKDVAKGGKGKGSKRKSKVEIAA